jgi:hypothetical protein
VYFPSLIFGLFYLFLHSDIIQFTNCSLSRVGAIELSVDSYVLKLLDVCPGSTFFSAELRFQSVMGSFMLSEHVIAVA